MLSLVIVANFTIWFILMGGINRHKVLVVQKQIQYFCDFLVSMWFVAYLDLFCMFEID